MTRHENQNNKRGNAAATQPKPAGILKRRHWWETATVAIVLIVAIAGGYYGFYVTQRTERLSDYYARNLASAATIVQQTIEGVWLNVCNARNDQERMGMISGMQVIDANSWPKFGGEEVGQGEPVEWCESDPPVKATALWDDGSSVLRFSDNGHTAQMRLSSLLSSSLPALNFDAVLLTRGDGEVLFSRSARGLNVVRLPIDDDSLPPADSADSGASDLPHDRFTTLTDLSIAGTEYKVFAQPVRMPIDLRWDSGRECESDDENDCMSAESVWLLVGLKPSGAFRSEGMAISPTALMIAFGVAVIALLSLPYLKLRFLGRREALHTHDVLVLMSALLIGTTIATFTLLEIYARVQTGPQLDERLEKLSSNISTAFHEELACLDVQLRALTSKRADNISDLVWLLKEDGGDSGLLQSYPFLEMAIWIKEDGWQANKWSIEERTTAQIQVENREYFRRARDRRFEPMPLIHCRFTDILSPGPLSVFDDTERGFFLDSIRSRTTGAVNSVLSQRLTGQSAEVTATETEKPVIVATALAPLLSLTDPTLPPGFEFAVIDNDGVVLYHSNSNRNLRENFFDELADAMELNAAVRSRGTVPVSADRSNGAAEAITINYHARTYRANHVRLIGTPYTLVALYDVGTYRVARAEVLTFALAISLIYTVLLIVVFALLHLGLSGGGRTQGSIFHWLWPSHNKNHAYAGILTFSVAAFLAWLLILALAPPLLEVVLSVILGVLTFVLCFLTFRRAAIYPNSDGFLARMGAHVTATYSRLFRGASERTKREKKSEVTGESSGPRADSKFRLYTWAIVMVIVVLSVLPPVAFYRATNNEIMELFTMGDQLRWADGFRERADRMQERYRVVPIRNGVAETLEGELFPNDGQLTTALDTHSADWDAMVDWIDRDDENECDKDKCVEGKRFRKVEQPIVAELGSKILGVLRESWEMRTLARNTHRHWYSDGERIYFVDRDYHWKPGLGMDGDTTRPANPEAFAAIYLSSPWPGLALPQPGNLAGWAWILILFSASVITLYLIVRTIAKLVFLTDLKEPYFLPVRSWSDLDCCRRMLVLRGTLADEPVADGQNVIRIDASGTFDLGAIETLEAKPEDSEKATVIVDRFHFGLWDSEIAEKKLELLERLVALDCRILVHSEVNPLHFFTMVAGDYYRQAAPFLPDMGRWSAALADFTRCREILNKEVEQAELETRLVEIYENTFGAKNIEPHARKALERLAAECWPGGQLQVIAEQLARRKDVGNLIVDGDDEYLVNQVLDLAESHYRMLWSISGKDERMVLYRLASHGFASWRGRELVRRLLHRGLIYMDPGPSLMNESFRRFVRDAELPAVFDLWTQQEGKSPWSRLRTPIIVAVIGIFLFLFATQPQLFNQSLAFTTAIAAIVPTFVKIVSLVAVSRTGSAH